MLDAIKVPDRAHILFGLVVAHDNFRQIAEVINTSTDINAAREGLLALKFEVADDIRKAFGFSLRECDLDPHQVRAISDLRLARFTREERQRVFADLVEEIAQTSQATILQV